MSKPVLVAMSGGVDSSVAALLLQKEGYAVTGVFMSHGVKTLRGSSKTCCSVDDAHDARRVADTLGIPFYTLNMESDFRRLMEHVATEYGQGRTPNPCVRCNRWFKFGRLFNYADALGIQTLATGHYARLTSEGYLSRAVDPGKDQSYVLFNLPRHHLPRVLLPVGEFPKVEIRKIAHEARLPVADKPDSQGICFIPDGDLPRFLSERGVGTPGPILDFEGKYVGQHEGFEYYTIGQRQGLGVALGRPMYISEIDPSKKAVVLAPDEHLYREGLEGEETNWLVEPEPLPGDELDVRVQVRAHNPPTAARVSILDSGSVRVRFETPVRAVTPGQAAVFYRGDRVLGGCWISRAQPAVKQPAEVSPKEERVCPPSPVLPLTS